ncbi:MAG: hypothetical protein KatS3mg101_0763 [Patescibacteria group bacterium]|nr:MAG: hypothetical protein KatS3mg101_0763 [Patescibacteria group bacterium]
MYILSLPSLLGGAKMSAKKQQNVGERDSLALIIGGLFIIALVFAAYNYFNKSSDQFTDIDEEEILKGVGGSAEELIGDINGNAATDSKEPEKLAAAAKSQVLAPQPSVPAEWVPNNYKQGDIQGTSYTVKRGDTLWEIAEGAYGDGTQWTKILEANKNDIGFLPNGKQALIVPGQILVLP